jgi:hypothetical protein
MDASRSLIHLMLAFGASCGAWLGLGEPGLGIARGIIYGAAVGVILGKLVFRR